MTAVRAAGYTSAGPRPGQFDPTGMGAQTRGPAPPLQKRADNSPEDACREMEKEVNALIEESALLSSQKEHGRALEKAKEAGKRERQLCKQREQNGLADQINIDLTYSVCFNLANQYHANGLYTEALNTYSLIVKNKQYAQSGRLRVNMGNIYYEQQKYPAAIKMYRMALDQIPNTGKEIKHKIMRNIGNAFVRLGQFQDALASYEQIMEGAPDLQTGFNLVLCYYALGDKERMRKGFSRLLSVRQIGMDAEELESTGMEEVLEEDGLKQALRERQKQTNKYLSVASKLLAPVIDKDIVAGFDWVGDALRVANQPALATEMQIGKALFFMRSRQFDKAIETLKSYEKKEQQLVAHAATNLSFIYFHEGDYNAAIKYADVAMKHNRYNAKALVNKGNCMFMRSEYEAARSMSTRRWAPRRTASRRSSTWAWSTSGWASTRRRSASSRSCTASCPTRSRSCGISPTSSTSRTSRARRSSGSRSSTRACRPTPPSSRGSETSTSRRRTRRRPSTTTRSRTATSPST